MPRPNWVQRIRESGAVSPISRGRFDLVDLPALRGLCDDFLGAAGPASPLPWRERPPVQRRTAECDRAVVSVMAGRVHGELYVHEAALLSCMHALTGPGLRAQLEVLHDLATDPDQDALTFFETRIRLYLHCLELALDQRPDVFPRIDGGSVDDDNGGGSSYEGVVVEQLLCLMAVAKGGSKPGSAEGFPLVWRLLWAMTRGGRRNVSELEHLPDATISLCLQRFRLGPLLGQKLDELRGGQRWRHVRELVKGVAGVAHLPRARAVLERVLPDYATWAAWRPDKDRLRRWASPPAAPHLRALEPLLQWEGPDSTGEQRATLLQARGTGGPGAAGCCELDGSSPVVAVATSAAAAVDSSSSSTHSTSSYPWSPREPAGNNWVATPLTPPVDPMSGKSVQERMLLYLDHAIAVGPEAVNLFVHFFAPLFEPDSIELEHKFAAALELEDDLSCRVLLRFVKAMEDPEARPEATAASLADAIPIITTRPRLQVFYGKKMRLRFRAPEVLQALQKEFCDLLVQEGCRRVDAGADVPGHEARPFEPVGLGVQRLGRAMLNAAWLRDDWRREYVEALSRIPGSAGELKASFVHLSRCSDAAARDGIVQRLTYRLGASLLDAGGGGGGSSIASGASSPAPAPFDMAVLPLDALPLVVLPPSTIGQAGPFFSPPRPHVPTPLAARRRPPPPPPQPVVEEEPLTDHCDRLRALVRAIPGVQPSLTAACTRQARLEHDWVVAGLVDILFTGQTDQVCVNLANYIARPGAALAHECWRDLLLHSMRQLPEGMLARCAESLSFNSWTTWIANLSRLLGDRHLEGEDGGGGGGVVGFTREGIASLSARKAELHRSKSMKTIASGRTGRRSFVSAVSSPSEAT